MSDSGPVYCSGPMFSDADKGQQALIAAELEAAGYETYLPQRDGLEVGKLMGAINSPLMMATAGTELMLKLRQAVFALDIYQLLERCPSLVFDMDGRVPDEGSVVETAAAFAAGKPIVIFKTTPIAILDGTDNPMVTGLSSSWQYVGAVKDIPGALGKAIAATAALGPYAYDPPPHVAKVIETGEEVWKVLCDLRAKHRAAAFEDIVRDLAGWADEHHGLRGLLDHARRLLTG